MPYPKEILPNWSAVFSLLVGVTGLVTAEFLPVSLLTPIAHDLAISEAVAGQSVTASGVTAVITSLLLSSLSKNLDRRYILLTFSLLLVLSNIMVAMANSSILLFSGRCLLGISVGGFWSMCSAVTLRLVPVKYVAQALSIIYAGVSLATIISMPLASYLGSHFGWRNVFLMAAAMGVIALIWQFKSLPSLPAKSQAGFGGMLALLKQKWVLLGMMGAILDFGGHFAFFTYLRPFLEQNLSLKADALSMVLLAFGISTCLGTTCAGLVLGRWFKPAMVVIPVLLTMLAVFMIITQNHTCIAILLIVLWGLIYGIIPVGWSAWITRTMPEEAESAGGLLVAAIQFAITIGAAVGGGLFDHFGFAGALAAAGIFMFFASSATRQSLSIKLS